MKNTNIALTFAIIGLIFMFTAAGNIAAHIWTLDTIPITHRVPLPLFKTETVIRNCCGHNICVTERHHVEVRITGVSEETEFVSYKTVLEI